MVWPETRSARKVLYIRSARPDRLVVVVVVTLVVAAQTRAQEGGRRVGDGSARPAEAARGLTKCSRRCMSGLAGTGDAPGEGERRAAAASDAHDGKRRPPTARRCRRLRRSSAV